MKSIICTLPEIELELHYKLTHSDSSSLTLATTVLTTCKQLVDDYTACSTGYVPFRDR